MSKQINVTETYLPPIEEYFQYLEKIWASGQLTNRGDLTKKLESSLQSYLNSSAKPLAVSNGTIAIQLELKAMGISGEVITTPFSYIATTSSLIWENCTPVFVDIEPDHLTINPKLIEERITENTQAILATHVFGNPCDTEAIEAIAEKYKLSVIYDAAHCFGVNYQSKSLFDYGDISTCSFHATKLFHTAEGGGVFSNNKQIEEAIFQAHNFGHAGPGKIDIVGINGKLSEVQAAMGLAVLPYINAVIEKRKQIYEAYMDELNFEGYRTISIRENTDWNYSYLPIIFESEEHLEKVLAALVAEKISPRRYFYPSLNTLSFVDYSSCPVSEVVSTTVLCLPMGHSLNEQEIKKISKIVNR